MPNTAASDRSPAGSSSLVDREDLNDHAKEEQVAGTTGFRDSAPSLLRSRRHAAVPRVRARVGTVSRSRCALTEMSDDARLEEAVQRLVRAFRPLRVVLFGSRARDICPDDSDYDVAAIAVSHAPWYVREADASHALRGLGLALEVVVLTPGELDADSAIPGSLAWRIEREGRVLYDAQVAA
jgi:predicted nucleotidyltransferase